MRAEMISGGLALAVLSLAGSEGPALADSLTRSKCWIAHFANGAERTACFFETGRVTMKNSNRTTDGKWSTCSFVGRYVTRDDGVEIKIPDHSDKCTNGARSPNFNASCKFSGDSIECEGSSTFGGKTYEFSGTFK